MITQLGLDAESASNDAWAKIVPKWVEMYMTGSKETKLLGMFRVIESNRLAEDSGTGVQTALAFCKRGFVSAPLMGMESHIDVLPTAQARNPDHRLRSIQLLPRTRRNGVFKFHAIRPRSSTFILTPAP